MVVTFLKRHHKHKAGDIAEVKDSVAKYLIKVKVATVESATDEAIEKTLTKNLKKAKKKK